jgi:hypothetical protein
MGSSSAVVGPFFGLVLLFTLQAGGYVPGAPHDVPPMPSTTLTPLASGGFHATVTDTTVGHVYHAVMPAQFGAVWYGENAGAARASASNGGPIWALLSRNR